MRKLLSLDYFLFYLVLFSLPFGKSLFVPILFAWLCAVSLSYFIKRDYFFYWYRGLLILPVIFYLLQIIGMAISQNFSGGLFDMQLKLSLILVPLLYPAARASYRNNELNFLRVFVMGCVAASLYFLGYATYRSYTFANGVWIFNPIPKYGWNNYFFSTEFSHLIHPSYLALYLLFALLVVGFELRRWRKISSVVKIVMIIGIPVLLLSLVLLQSRAGILGFGFLALVWILYLVFAKRRYIIGGGALLILMALAVVVITKFNRLSNTATSLENTADSGLNQQSKEDATAIRFWIWKSALTVIQEHPVLGVGTGDVRNELQKQYVARGMTTSAFFKHNAHNQYLETWLGTGTFGLLGLLAMLFVPLWVGVKKGDWLLVGFLSLCSVSFMFESMLNTIAGVGFFAIFYTMLVSNLAVKRI